MCTIWKVFAVKPGVEPLLDVARASYSDAVEKIYAYADEFAASCSVASLKIAQDKQRGFYLVCKATEERRKQNTLRFALPIKFIPRASWCCSTRLHPASVPTSSSLCVVMLPCSTKQKCYTHSHSAFGPSFALELILSCVQFA